MSYRVVNGKLLSTVDFKEYSYPELQNKKENVNSEQSTFNKILDKQIKKQECFTISSHAA